jgi:hypothetical protein
MLRSILQVTGTCLPFRTAQNLLESVPFWAYPVAKQCKW